MAVNKIGRYEIKSELGRGGMATVFVAHDPSFGREVAVKVLPKMFLHDPQFRTRFDREAKTIALLEHNAIVPVYDFGEDDGQPYIVMRLMTGGDLGDRIKKGPMSPEDVSKTLNRIADALDLAHARGVIHRDLKPGNILFDQYNDAFLSDFGIARLKEAEGTLTGGAIIGTPAYMSPEQVQGNSTLDGRSDIYALGVITFQMLTGQMPYRADTPAKIMMMHILEPVPKVRDTNPTLSPEIAQVVEKAMAKNPDERYQTAKELSKAFELACFGVPAPSTRPPMTQPGQEQAATFVAANKTRQAGPMQPNTPAAGAFEKTSVQVAPQAPVKRFSFLGIALGIVGIIGVGAILFISGIIPLGQAALADTPTVTNPPAPTATEVFVAPTQTLMVVAPTNTQETIPSTSTPTATSQPTQTSTPEPSLTPTPEPTPTAGIPIIGGADKFAYLRSGEIWISNVDGTDNKALTQDRQSKAFLSWSPDGEQLLYRSGKCIKSISEANLEPIDIVCVLAAEFFEGFSVSPDGTKLALSVDNQMYIVPFDIPALQAVRLRSDLTRMAECKSFAPYTRNFVKDMYWSSDMTQMGVLIIGVGSNGLWADIIQVLDISTCTDNPRKLDEFPASRFTPDGYDKNPVLLGIDWDGVILFTMNTFVRNDGFGDLWVYNYDRKRAEKVNPIEGRCCYRDSQWSPDGRMLMFAFQDFALGAGSKTYLYYVPYSQVNTGSQLIPVPIDPLDDPKEAPWIAIRPATKP